MKIIVMLTMSATLLGSSFMQAYDDTVECKDGVCTIKKNHDKVSDTTQHVDDTILEITSLEQFNALITQATKPVIVDFYATWCQPCNNMKPIIHDLAQQKKDWQFVVVDIDKAPTIATAYNIEVLPTFVVFKEGKQWNRFQGMRSSEQFTQEVTNVLLTEKPVVVDNQEAAQLQQLIMAIAQKDITSIKQCLADNVNVNKSWQSAQGEFYPLHAAIISTNKEIIDIILNAGATMSDTIQDLVFKQIDFVKNMCVNLQDAFTYTQNKIAALPQPIVQQNIIAEQPTSAQEFLMAIHDPVKLKELIDRGVDASTVFTIRNNNEMTPLYLAIILNNKPSIDVLVESGATLATEFVNEQGIKKSTDLIIHDHFSYYATWQQDVLECLTYALEKAPWLNR